MAETRLQQQLKEVIVREIEDSFGSRFEKLESAMETQRNEITTSIEAQRAEMSTNIAELFEGLRLFQAQISQGDCTNQSSSSNNNGNRTTTYGSRITRLAKVDFPRFNGANIKEWMFTAEQFFDIDHTVEDLKVRLVTMHLDGEAATWHQSILHSDIGRLGIQTWITYKELLLERFGDVFDDPAAELKRLQETDGIKAYHIQFEKLRARLNVSEDYLVRQYLVGLRLDTQLSVRMFQPQTVKHCFMLANLYETSHPKQASGPEASGRNNSKGLIPFKKDTTAMVIKEVKSGGEPNLISTEASRTQRELSRHQISNQIKALESPVHLQVPNSNLESSLKFHNASLAVCDDYYAGFGLGDLCDRAELSQKQITVLHVHNVDENFVNSASITSLLRAYQVFERMLVEVSRVKRKCMQKKIPKSWKFKYKIMTQRRFSIVTLLVTHFEVVVVHQIVQADIVEEELYGEELDSFSDGIFIVLIVGLFLPKRRRQQHQQQESSESTQNKDMSEANYVTMATDFAHHKNLIQHQVVDSIKNDINELSCNGEQDCAMAAIHDQKGMSVDERMVVPSELVVTLWHNGLFHDASHYRQLIGKLISLQATGSSFGFAVFQLNHYVFASPVIHLLGVSYVLPYLKLASDDADYTSLVNAYSELDSFSNLLLIHYVRLVDYIALFCPVDPAFGIINNSVLHELQWQPVLLAIFLHRHMPILIDCSGWFRSILDFLYCSLPRPPDNSEIHLQQIHQTCDSWGTVRSVVFEFFSRCAVWWNCC